MKLSVLSVLQFHNSISWLISLSMENNKQLATVSQSVCRSFVSLGSLFLFSSEDLNTSKAGLSVDLIRRCDFEIKLHQLLIALTEKTLEFQRRGCSSRPCKTISSLLFLLSGQRWKNLSIVDFAPRKQTEAAIIGLAEFRQLFSPLATTRHACIQSALRQFSVPSINSKKLA